MHEMMYVVCYCHSSCYYCFHPSSDAVVNLIVTPEVSEGGVATVTLSDLEGALGEEVEVRVTTIDGNATGGLDYQSLTGVVLSAGDSVDIEIFDNSVFEGDKFFSVAAELVNVGRVGLTPSVATVTIIENDEPPQG